jgi:hypothetical protein
LSSSQSSFLSSSPFAYNKDDNFNSFESYFVNRNDDTNLDEEVLNERMNSSSIFSLFSSLSNEKLLFYSLSALLSFSSHVNNYNSFLKKDLNLFLLIFDLFGCIDSGEIIEIIMLIFYNIMKSEKILSKKESYFNKMIRKYKFFDRMYLMVKDRGSDSVFLAFLKNMVFIGKSSFEEIYIPGEKNVVQWLEDIVKLKVKGFSISLFLPPSENSPNFSDEVCNIIFYFV